jgi:hypothetical protein
MAKGLAHFAPGLVHLQAATWEMKSGSENALCVVGSWFAEGNSQADC